MSLALQRRCKPLRNERLWWGGGRLNVSCSMARDISGPSSNVTNLFVRHSCGRGGHGDVPNGPERGLEGLCQAHHARELHYLRRRCPRLRHRHWIR
mmetsp:Transcript_7590/g.23088  ORF Transcript_7590/g.23088 Transcript_7590/m.23088 type:complete len:96 (+) Transcript_7590:278-565(+)